MINIDSLLARHDGLILARDVRGLKSSLSRWVQQGKLKRLMRGVYAHPQAGLRDRIHAVLARIPGAVIAGQTALSLQVDPTRPVDTIHVCTPTHRAPQPGYRFTQRTIPREHARHGIMTPVLAAVDVSDHDTFWLDDLARRGRATHADYQQILHEFPCRMGNKTRRRNVARTSTKPWSAAERQYHDLFDAHHIKGWVANEPIRINGVSYIPDIAFMAQKLAIEIDGRAFHADAKTFEADRHRQDELIAAGWTVLRFTWQMLSDPEWIITTLTTVLIRLRRSRRRRD